MSKFYRFSNLLIGFVAAAAAVGVAYMEVPRGWAMLDEMFASAFSVVLLVMVLIVGFLTMESRRY